MSSPRRQERLHERFIERGGRPHATAASPRVPLELLAMGACWSLAAVACYLPFLLSSPAGQNDRFLTNAVLGLGLFLVGDTLLIVATDWVVPRRWHCAALVAASVLLVLALTPGGGVPGGLAGVGVVIASYTAILLALSIIAARRQGWLGALGRALMLALGAVAVFVVSYAWLGGRTLDTLPYLDGVSRVVALIIGPLVYFIGRVWSHLD